MNLLRLALVAVASATFLSGAERRYEKNELVLGDLGPPSFNVSGKWNGTWQDTRQKSTESFTMELVQTGRVVKGTARFMDSSRTKATIVGEASGSKLRLVMTPQPSFPETTWIGSVNGQTIAGTWYFHGTPARGLASTGPWSAAAKLDGAPKNQP